MWEEKSRRRLWGTSAGYRSAQMSDYGFRFAILRDLRGRDGARLVDGTLLFAESALTFVRAGISAGFQGKNSESSPSTSDLS